MSKTLELTLNLDDSHTMTISIPYPKEDLSLSAVKEQVEKIIPVLESTSGASVTGLKQAKIIESTSTVLE